MDRPMNDIEAIQAVIGGDKEAFSWLVDRYYARSLRFAVRMLQSQEDGEETVQDAFVRAYQTLDKYEHRDRFEAWLFKILVNRCRTRTAARNRGMRNEPLAEETPAARNEMTDPLLKRDLGLALAQLVPEQREAFILKFVEDMTYEEMADVTGAEVSALKMRVMRAREQLKKLLTREGDTE